MLRSPRQIWPRDINFSGIGLHRGKDRGEPLTLQNILLLLQSSSFAVLGLQPVWSTNFVQLVLSAFPNEPSTASTSLVKRFQKIVAGMTRNLRESAQWCMLSLVSFSLILQTAAHSFEVVVPSPNHTYTKPAISDVLAVKKRQLSFTPDDVRVSAPHRTIFVIIVFPYTPRAWHQAKTGLVTRQSVLEVSHPHPSCVDHLPLRLHRHTISALLFREIHFGYHDMCQVVK